MLFVRAQAGIAFLDGIFMVIYLNIKYIYSLTQQFHF